MAEGFRLVSGGTDNHLMLLSLIGFGLTGVEAEHMLDAADITTNKNAVPGDPQPPAVTSGIRLGTAAMTTRGFDEADMKRTGEAIALVLKNKGSAEATEKARAIAGELTAAHPLYKGQ